VGREVVWIDYGKLERKLGFARFNESLKAYKAVNISHRRMKSKLYDVLIIMSMALSFISI